MGSRRDEEARELVGYAATALGGLVGGVAAGVGSWVLSSTYYTRQIVDGIERGESSDSLDELAAAIFLTVVLGLLGAGLGAGGMVKALRYSRPVLSGFLFVVLVVFLVPLLAGVGAVLLPVNIGIAPGAVIVSVVSSALAGVIARGVVHHLDVRDGVQSVPPRPHVSAGDG